MATYQSRPGGPPPRRPVLSEALIGIGIALVLCAGLCGLAVYLTGR